MDGETEAFRGVVVDEGQTHETRTLKDDPSRSSRNSDIHERPRVRKINQEET